jgi:DNA-binding transcriptional LysR family regulator
VLEAGLPVFCWQAGAAGEPAVIDTNIRIIVMLHLTLRQFEIFCAVAQSGTTVAAAEAVALSQSATSAALQQLEQGLGVQLFERVGKRLVLNDAGRALLPQALGVLEQARGIEQTFSARAANMPVRLRVAASTTIGTYALPEVLARLARSHPLVRVDLQIANTQEVGEAVLAMEVDMGLIEGSSHWQGLEVEPWLRDELVIVASPQDPLAEQARSKPLGVAALRKAAWLLREAGSGTREMVEHALLPHLHQLPAAPRWAAPRRLHAVSSRGWASAVCRACWCSHSCRPGRWRFCPPPCRACGATSLWCSAPESAARPRCRPLSMPARPASRRRSSRQPKRQTRCSA